MPDLHAFEHHWQDEADAAYLYRLLAAAEPDREEEGHLLAARGGRGPARRGLGRAAGAARSRARRRSARAARTRLLAWLGKLFGPGFLLPMLLAEEGREVKAYLDMHRATPRGVRRAATRRCTLARESAEHATTLERDRREDAASRGTAPESGGFLRNVVYGFNDGLTANFGLVAGVIGATRRSTQHHAVIVAGVAGLIADALSMGSSGYLAAQERAARSTPTRSRWSATRSRSCPRSSATSSR